MKQYKVLSYLAAGAVLFASCEPEIELDKPAAGSGSADFSRYIAIGNSLTAGFADGALNYSGQVNAYPAILADRMAFLNEDLTFNTPFLPQGVINGTVILTPNIASPIGVSSGGLDPSVIAEPVSGTFQNLGIPGIRLVDADQAGYNGFNTYLGRISSENTLIDLAVEQNPTFFTIWLGNNDVLGNALDGGQISRSGDGELIFGADEITDSGVFESAYDAILNKLTANGAKGAIANIPSITSIPYFAIPSQIIGNNGLALDATQAGQLTAGFAAQIDPQIEAQVEVGVITQVVLETAVNSQIIPPVAEGIVREQIANSEPCSLSTDPDACADAVIASGGANEQIAAVEQALRENYFLANDARDPTYAQAYTIIDQQVVANQSSIDSQTQQTLAAYRAEQLPAAQQQELATAIAGITAQNITGLKAQGFYPQFVDGTNGFVVESGLSPTGLVQINNDARITFNFIAAGYSSPEAIGAYLVGRNYIIEDKFILDQNEIAIINQTVGQYNAIIADLADEYDLALVDMFSYFNGIVSNGLSINGVNYNADFADVSDVDSPGGLSNNPGMADGVTLFSLDGVHLNQRGYAVVANQFIQAINAEYGAGLVPLTDSQIATYPTIPFPKN
jgi:lysophospholipase L1-like esterase